MNPIAWERTPSCPSWTYLLRGKPMVHLFQIFLMRDSWKVPRKRKYGAGNMVPGTNCPFFRKWVSKLSIRHSLHKIIISRSPQLRALSFVLFPTWEAGRNGEIDFNGKVIYYSVFVRYCTIRNFGVELFLFLDGRFEVMPSRPIRRTKALFQNDYSL